MLKEVSSIQIKGHVIIFFKCGAPLPVSGTSEGRHSKFDTQNVILCISSTNQEKINCPQRLIKKQQM